MSDAELTSNLESENECVGTRKRKKKNIYFPGEISSDEEVQSFEIPEAYPAPPHKKPQSAAYQNDYEQHAFGSPTRMNLETSDHVVSGPSQQIESVFESHSPLEDSEHPISVNLYPQSHQESTSELQKSVVELQLNQKNLWSLHSELASALNRIEAKVDLLLARNAADSFCSVDSSNMDQEVCLLSSLPVDVEGFAKLNGQLENQTFRQRLKKVLLTTGGKDVKTLAANLLRKIVRDEIADVYSLTGRSSASAIQKQPFDKTGIYSVISEICFRCFGNSQEGTVREAVSDWLMQAKFRKSRRERRKNGQATLPHT